MNHRPVHTKLTRELSEQVRTLQRQGYFGDGLWSAGHRLEDGETVQGVRERHVRCLVFMC